MRQTSVGRRRFASVLATVVALSSGSRDSLAQLAPDASRRAVTTAADRATRTAMADSASWPSYGRDYTNRRYAPLTQISAANVGSM